MANNVPILDVMVPTHNHLELTIQCLDALYQHTGMPFHLIVVDYSTDLTPIYLNQFAKEHEDVTIVNTGKPSAKCGNEFFNIALRYCQTEFMATVMNSVRVEPGWAVGGLQVMRENPSCGIVGFKCIFDNGLIESAGIKMNQYLPCDVGRNEPGHRLSFVYQPDSVQWAFALLRVAAVKDLLPEDIFHGHVGWDDIDNSFLLKKAGKQVFFCGSSVGYHKARATRGDNSPEAQQKNQENGITFYKRWGFWDEFVKQHGPDASIHTPPKNSPARMAVKI